MLQDTLGTLAHCELEEHVPVKLTTSHPLVEDGGDTVWNVGTSVDPEGKGGYSYSVVRFRRDRPGVTGTMMIEDAQVRQLVVGHHVEVSCLCSKTVGSTYRVDISLSVTEGY